MPDLGPSRRLDPDPSVGGTTFGVALQRLADADPDATAVTCGAESVTRSALLDRAYDVGLGLAAAGVRPGDLVTIVRHNSVDAVVETFGAWLVGAVPQVLAPTLAPRELADVVAVGDPAVLLGEVDPGLTGGRPVLTAADLASAARAGVLRDVASPAWKAPTSGGSTGRPKVIVAGQPALMEHMVLGEVFRIPESGGVLVTAPMSHNAPFCAAVLGVLRGAHTILMPRFDAREALRLVAEHRVRWVYAVPTMMARIWKLPVAERAAADVSSVEVWLHMAAACAPALKEAYLDWLGPDRVWELYGGTEAQAVTLLDGHEWLAHRGSVGRPVAGAVQVRDDDGAPVPAGVVGRVWLRRDAGTPPTYRYLGAEARADEEGWETLGDLGHLDADGYLYLADRDADMFTVGGVNVYPAEVEAVLVAHASVLDACVVGEPDEELGSVPWARVQTAAGAEVPDLQEWLAAHLAPHKRPRSVEFVATALRDDAGKVRRSELRRERAVPA